MSATHIVVDHVSKVFQCGGREVVALKDFALNIPQGQFV